MTVAPFVASLSLWSNRTTQMFTRQSKGLLKSSGQQTVNTEVSVHALTNCVLACSLSIRSTYCVTTSSLVIDSLPNICFPIISVFFLNIFVQQRKQNFFRLTLQLDFPLGETITLSRFLHKGLLLFYKTIFRRWSKRPLHIRVFNPRVSFLSQVINILYLAQKMVATAYP